MTRINFSIKSRNESTTRLIGKELGKILDVGSILALEGELGCGKTIFVQGLAKGLGIENYKDVRSPTFSLIQEYDGVLPLCHVDLYRISKKDSENLGLEEYWEKKYGQKAGWVTAIEWPDRAEFLLPLESHPQAPLRIKFNQISKKERTLSFTGNIHWNKRLKKWKRLIQKKY